MNLIILLLFLSFPILLFSQNQTNLPCPLDFSVLNKFISAAKENRSLLPNDTRTLCQSALGALHLVESKFLKTSSLFYPPLNSSSSCWNNFQSLVAPFFPSPFNLLRDCGFQAPWISQGCMNISTRSDFEKIVPQAAILDMGQNCNQSLGSSAYSSQCTACSTSLNRVKASYLPGPDHGNVTQCTNYPSIYAAGLLNQFGPDDNDTALCLFLLKTQSGIDNDNTGSGFQSWIIGVIVGGILLLALIGLSIWYLIRKREIRNRRLKRTKATDTKSQALESISASTTLVKYSFEEIKAATKKFSRDNIIGKGGYGNVYKGKLRDGSEVALKRFKNCSAAGDESFAHEVEVIASVRHVNLVALRGYCTATTQMEGHQRIIVCDLMKNGSLHDHLFSSEGKKLSWPIRQKIAVGTARGLAYLHYGAQPAILHRDIKASNILLDEMFEPKVADFGLARFAPEGMSHVSTRVAGTLGYVAPEYALYGQLTEKSDVFSFGVVMLELLSGKKAFLSSENGQNTLSIEISKIQFQIKKIDYDQRILRLCYPDIHKIISSPYLTNITTETTDSNILTYTKSDRALIVYYDCPLPYNLSYVACLLRNNEDISCFSLDNKFQVHADRTFQFCNSCQFFVLETVVEDLLKKAVALLKALEQGFDLSWTAGEGWCDDCKLSNGVCGNNPDLANSTACFCPDGNATLRTCETKRINMPAGIGYIIVPVNKEMPFHMQSTNLRLKPQHKINTYKQHVYCLSIIHQAKAFDMPSLICISLMTATF